MLDINDPKLVSIMVDGGVGILPTDTIYGLVAVASNRKAVARLYSLKQRDQKPGPIIAANVQQLTGLGLDNNILQKVAHYWPNPISIVIKSSDEFNYLHLGVGSLAVRIPKDQELRRLLEQTGPLLASSANHAGMPAANTVQEALHYFEGQVDFWVDGGDLSNRAPSTVASIVDNKFVILRQGAVKINPNGKLVKL